MSFYIQARRLYNYRSGKRYYSNVRRERCWMTMWSTTKRLIY